MIRVGLIGYGYAGRTFHVPLIGATPGLEVAAIASSQDIEVSGARIVRDPAALLDLDLDLIVVASPNDSHARWATAALHAGKHVVVEKPFATSIADARGVIETARNARRLISVFHNRRWDSDFLSVRTAIQAGKIGRVVHFESHFDRFRPQVRDRWRERAGPGGGIWFDLGPHLIDQAVQLFGRPQAVEADIATLREGGQADDWAHVVLHYADRRVVLHASMLVAGGSPRFIVHGDGGSLIKAKMDPQESQLLAGMVPGEDGWGDDGEPLLHYDVHGKAHALPPMPGDQRAFYRGVAAAIRGEAPNPVPPEESLHVMILLDAAQRASAEQRRIALS